MLKQIVSKLKSRSDLAGWSVRHITTASTQVFAVPKEIEAQREVSDETYKVLVLVNTRGSDGRATVGSGESTLLPGGNIDKAIETAVVTSQAITNPPYTLPDPAPIPDVPLVDQSLVADPAAALNSIAETLRSEAAKYARVRLTSFEIFGDLITTHLVNNRGINAEQQVTRLYLEFVLQSSQGGKASETIKETFARRVEDLRIAELVEERARNTVDMLGAGPAPDWEGTVIMRNDVLAGYLVGDPLQGSTMLNLASAASKFAKLTPWEVGKSVFSKPVMGDPLTVFTDRTAPYSISADRFDNEGIPAQRVELIRDNKLVTFQASQKYATYLKLPANGESGQVQVPPGQTPLASLLAEPYIEVSMFSWFNPDVITGDFATEIRLGYLVENGQRHPFRGGQLIGNSIDGLGACRWSKEISSFGNYAGPVAASFSGFKVAGAI